MASQGSIWVYTAALLGVAIVIGASSLIVWGLGLMSTTRTARNLGSVRTVNVGAYWDTDGTNMTETIDWGTLSPGDVASRSFYLRNEGTWPMSLSLTTQNWSPADASSYMSVSWNRERHTLAAGNTILATLTLDISSSISGIESFSFDLVITGTEQ